MIKAIKYLTEQLREADKLRHESDREAQENAKAVLKILEENKTLKQELDKIRNGKLNHDQTSTKKDKN